MHHSWYLIIVQLIQLTNSFHNVNLNTMRNITFNFEVLKLTIFSTFQPHFASKFLFLVELNFLFYVACRFHSWHYFSSKFPIASLTSPFLPISSVCVSVLRLRWREVADLEVTWRQFLPVPMPSIRVSPK